MKLFTSQALLAAIAVSSLQTAESIVTSDRVTKVDSSSKHIKFTKQFTVSTHDDLVPINGIELSLSGNVFVSYTSGVEDKGILAYVNVSGDSEATVNAVTVEKDVDLLVDSELKVKLSNSHTSGYMLTEIFLTSPQKVTNVESVHSAQVFIGDDVLLKDSKAYDLEIEVKDTSMVHVSSPESDMKPRKVSLKAHDDARIMLNAKSVSPWQELEVKAEDASDIDVLTTTVRTTDLDLESKNHNAKICISAKTLDTLNDSVDGSKRVSIPNSSDKHESHGNAQCQEPSDLPDRDAGKIVAPPSLLDF